MLQKYVFPIAMTAVGVIVGLIVYDMFVKGLTGQYESQSNGFEVDERGKMMKVA